MDTRDTLQDSASERGLRLVQQVTAALSTGEPLEGLPEAAARIADALAFQRAAVLVVPDTTPAEIVLIANSDEPRLTQLRFDLSRYPEVATAIRTRRPVFAGEASLAPLPPESIDVADTADLTDALHAEQVGSLLALPLAPEGRALGCLVLRASSVRQPPDEDELLALRLAAQVLAVALKSARIFEVLREQTGRTSLALLESERRARVVRQYRGFFESAADGVIVIDEALRILYVNRAAEQLTGWASAALKGRTLLELLPEPQREGLVDVVRKAARGAQLAGFDIELHTTSGEIVRVSASTSTALAEEGAVVLSFRDVTLARALEDELRNTKEFLERLIDAAIDGVIAADLRGRIVLFNKGAERVFGYRADEVLGKVNVAELYPEGEAKRVMALLRSETQGGVGRLEPTRLAVIAKGGARVPVQITASILYEEGVPVASVGIFSDLRDRMKMEERLVEAQQLLQSSEKQALIAELAGTAAHELNQPLTSVMGYAELLLKRLPDGEPSARAAAIILREAERMAEIVRKIGKITKYETKAYVGSATILDLDKSAT